MVWKKSCITLTPLAIWVKGSLTAVMATSDLTIGGDSDRCAVAGGGRGKPVYANRLIECGLHTGSQVMGRCR